MLRECAPGYETREGPHLTTVIFEDKVFPNLHQGAHDKKKEIKVSNVRQLARVLDILECAERELPQL